MTEEIIMMIASTVLAALGYFVVQLIDTLKKGLEDNNVKIAELEYKIFEMDNLLKQIEGDYVSQEQHTAQRSNFKENINKATNRILNIEEKLKNVTPRQMHAIRFETDRQPIYRNVNLSGKKITDPSNTEPTKLIKDTRLPPKETK